MVAGEVGGFLWGRGGRAIFSGAAAGAVGSGALDVGEWVWFTWAAALIFAWRHGKFLRHGNWWGRFL